MRRLFTQRLLRLGGAAAVVVAVAAGAAYATSALTSTTAAGNVVQACVKQNGDVRIVAGPSQCKHDERSMSWNVQGPKGDTGATGAPGRSVTGEILALNSPECLFGGSAFTSISGRTLACNGAPGESVHASALAGGGAGCAYGGSSFTVGGATTYACNGAPGANGQDGAGLTSIDGLSGLTCTNGGVAGTISVGYAPGGMVTLTCVTGSGGDTGGGGGGGGGGGTGDCTSGPVQNGFITCDGNGSQSLQCSVGFGDANGNPADGCEVSIFTDPNNCGGIGIVAFLPHAVTGCANGQPTLVACDPGWFDVDNNPLTGCESSMPDCGASPAVTHSTGLGQTFVDCSPLGTYTSITAMEAGFAWGAGRSNVVETTAVCDGGQGTTTIVARDSTNAWAAFTFAGPNAGHAVAGPGTSSPLCPAATDPAWQ